MTGSRFLRGSGFDPNLMEQAPGAKDFNDLGREIAAGLWREERAVLSWIWAQYSRLLTQSPTPPPPDFLPSDFMARIFLGEEESTQEDETSQSPPSSQQSTDSLLFGSQEGGRQAVAPLPFIADTPGAARAKVVPYSDSEEEEDPPSKAAAPSASSSLQPAPPPAPLPPSHFYALGRPETRQVKTFNVTQQVYGVEFQHLDQVRDVDAVLQAMFGDALQQVFAEGHPGDRVGVMINHPSLRKPYYIAFKPQGEITADRLLSIWQELVQSDEELALDQRLTIEFMRRRGVRGGRPPQSKWNHRKWMEKHYGHGGCFIRVHNPNDNLCLARSVVVARARLDKETDPQVAAKWNTIRQGGRAYSPKDNGPRAHEERGPGGAPGPLRDGRAEEDSGLSGAGVPDQGFFCNEPQFHDFQGGC